MTSVGHVSNVPILQKARWKRAPREEVIRMDYDQTSEQQRQALRTVAAYRDLCRAVSKNSTSGLFWGALMLGIWYMAFGQRNNYGPFSIIYLGLGAFEFTTSLWNRFRPSAEGILFSGLVIFLFGLSNITRNFLMWQAGNMRGFSFIWVMFGFYLMYSGINEIRTYFAIRKLFAQRPSKANLQFFEQMVKETLQSDPSSELDSLDLPTRPTVQAKLFGDTAFLVFNRGNDVAILGKHDFAIVPMDENNRSAVLMIEGAGTEPFELDRDNWRNYKQWRDAE